MPRPVHEPIGTVSFELARGRAAGDSGGKPLSALDERIPTMSEPELNNLQDNATRLATSGSAAQKAEAARLLPIIAEALEAARAARAAEMSEKRVVRQKEIADARAKRVAARKAEKEAAAAAKKGD